MSTEMIIGPPGCGKTTALGRRVTEVVEAGEPVLVCSLTRTAAHEIAGRNLPVPKEAVGTLHSHAYRAIGNPPVVGANMDEWNQANPAYALTGDAVDPDEPYLSERGDRSPGNQLSEEYHLLRARMVDRELWPERVRAFADRWESWKREGGMVDFTDMIDMAREVRTAPGAPSMIFADECLHGGSLVLTESGERLRISQIVEQRLPVKVACFNHRTDSIEFRMVTGWHKSPRRGRRMIRVGSLIATEDHRAFVPEKHQYIEFKSAIDLGTIPDNMIGHEEIRPVNQTLQSRTIHRDRVPARRRFNFEECWTGRKRSRQVRPGCCSSRIPLLEVPRNVQVGIDSTKYASDNSIRRRHFQILDSESSSFHGDPFSVLPRFCYAKNGHAGVAEISGYNGRSCLVHGRRIELREQSSILHLCFSGIGSDDPRGAPYVDGFSGGPTSLKGKARHPNQESRSRTALSGRRTIYPSMPIIQAQQKAAPADKDSRVTDDHRRTRVYQNLFDLRHFVQASEEPSALQQEVRSRNVGATGEGMARDATGSEKDRGGLRNLRNTLREDDEGVRCHPCHMLPEMPRSPGRQESARSLARGNPAFHVRVLQESVHADPTLATWSDIPVLFGELQGEGSKTKKVQSLWAVYLHDAESVEHVYCIDVEEHHNFFADNILVHNCQDHSRLELELLRTWAVSAGGLVICGDPHQALFVWRGAYPEMFTSPKIAPENRHVLSQSYRIPRAVHAAALQWIGKLSGYQPIEYRPRDAEGSAARFRATWRYPDDVVTFAVDQIHAGKSVMICATCSYLLAPTLAMLRAQGVPFSNPWRLRRGDWNPLRVTRGKSAAQRIAAFCKPVTGPVPLSMAEEDFDFGANAPEPAEQSVMWTATDLDDWVDLCKADGLLNRGAKSEIATSAAGESATSYRPIGIEDIEQWFLPEAAAFIARMFEGGADLDGALQWFESKLLAAKAKTAAYPLRVARHHGIGMLLERPRLYVGTIHAFKGAEADIVLIYPDLSPQGMGEWLGGPDSRDSILRAGYVALTRARESVYVCLPASAMSMNLWELVN